MELNREQIIKALECCHLKSEDCISCPFVLLGENCANLERDAITLIKELAEENEKLNERLGREARCQYDLCGQIVTLRDDVKYIKADTVQKMQTKILAKSEYGTINMSPWQLDQIAKEVLED